MKRLSVLIAIAVVTAVTLRSDVAEAQLGTATTTPACCMLTTSLVNDVIRGKDAVGDERFFMSEGAPPNIHFLIDNSCSMMELPQLRGSNHAAFVNSGVGIGDPNYNGCENTFLRAYQTAKNWNASTVYPVVDPGTGIGSDNGLPNQFVSNKFYNYMSWGDSSSPGARSETTSDAVCKSIHPNWASVGSADATKLPVCKRCLDERGFYREPSTSFFDGDGSLRNTNKFVFTGNFLNFNPPKYATLRRVMKDVVANLRRVRAGYSTFATDGSDGGRIRQKQNPTCEQIAKDSSSFDSNRASYISDIQSIRMETSTPLAETLFNIGQFFTSSDNVYTKVYGFDSKYLKGTYTNAQLNNGNRSWCWGCQISSVIIITDGEPTNDLWEDQGQSNFRSRLSLHNGGNVTCPDYDGNGVGDCAAAECVSGVGTCNGTGKPLNDLLDDVAKFLNTKDLQVNTPVIIGDLNTAGQQSLAIYAVGLGVRSALLRNASEGVGGGLYFEAEDGQQLKQAILDILQNVQTRATAFAAASVASLQVNRTGGSLLPRFRPAKQGTKGAWQGFLYRFELAHERVLGCDPVKALAPGGDPLDINQDGDCEDVNLMDKDPVTGLPKDAVIEDDQGNFVKLNDPLKPAVPFWEAGAKLNTASNIDWKPVDQGGRRKIYTIIDNGGPSGSPDGRIDQHDTPVEFRAENASQLREYLGIGNNLNECSNLAASLGLGVLSADDCAKIVINYYRGADVLNPDPAKRGFDRPFLLHDIFHSAPIVVEPLSEKAMCGTNQCITTLFDGKTPLDPAKGASGGDAYDVALQTRGKRDKIALVGSNGGMLHAFLFAKRKGDTFRDPVTGMYDYDSGTGEELWAFVPPDLLPKLRMNMGAHGYFVDGTSMVRDVWIDRNSDGDKDATEFRTVAITGEGEGGVHRFALDLTGLIGDRGTGHRPPNTKGDFLWMWPQPCDPDKLDLLVGESGGNFAPRAPPVGPVAIADTNGPYKIGNVNAVERWISFFNGGTDRYGMRGRGMAMVDIATGRTIWSFFHNDGKPNSSEAVFPFTAPVAMMDVGDSVNSRPDRDMLFDTATVGDFGGQLWTVRFWTPGSLSAPIASGGKVTNWVAARSFQSVKDLSVKIPFTHMTSNAVQPDTGYLRTFIGNGDRTSLLDTPGAVCRLSTPYGCARQGCNTKYVLQIERGGTKAVDMETHFDNKLWKHGPITTAAASGVCSKAKVTLTWKIDGDDAEDGSTTGGVSSSCSVNEGGKIEFLCDGATASWACRKTADEWISVAKATDPPTSTNARFFGLWSYGVDANRRFNTNSEATNFDSKRFQASDLTDVTAVTVTGGTPSAVAPSLGKGWLLRYAALDERTGSSSNIVNGCVVWNTFEPSGGTAMCSTAGTNTARFYQGGFVTGAPNCAKGFELTEGSGTYARSQSRSVVAVPGEPAVQRTVYGGQGGTSIITLEAGRSKADTVSRNQDLVQSLYTIEVDRAAHDCRHEGFSCK